MRVVGDSKALIYYAASVFKSVVLTEKFIQFYFLAETEINGFACFQDDAFSGHPADFIRQILYI